MFDSVHLARLPERLDGVRRPQQFICERRESGGENMSVSELVLSLEATDPSLLDRDGVNAALCSVARIHSWLEVKQAHRATAAGIKQHVVELHVVVADAGRKPFRLKGGNQ